MAKALYRQYRPQTFDQVLGQDRVVNVLKNQVQKGMISHAYLFAGERGCGKTTCAKIFAKAINCKNPQDGSPCLKCENCLSIDSETTMDIVEMDAASNRRIDDIRQIKETVMYPPNNLKYKVYIIDEAHMITKEAFNALLKIMEEPPSHLVFILATTEIDKIPSTILSRVQKFEFNKIDREHILKQIDIVLKDFDIKMEDLAKDLIVKNANGAMRDALSILDQVISSSKDYYSLSDVEKILGVVGFKDLFSLAEKINSYDKKSTLVEVFNLRENNKSNKDILDGLTTFYHDLLIYKSTMDSSYFDSEEKISYIEKFSDKIDNHRIMDSLEILSVYSEKMRYSENTDLILELALLRLIDYKNIKSLESRIIDLEKRSEDSITDMINSIVEAKLRHLEISSLDIKSIDANSIALPKSEDKTDLESEIKEVEEEKIHQTQSLYDEIDNSDNTKEVKDLEKSENIEPKEVKSKSISGKIFDKKTEEIIKNQMINQVGPLLRAMFNIEGFNYEFKGNIFNLYYKESMYHSMLDDKIVIIEKIIKGFTKDDIEVKIVKESERALKEEPAYENKTPTNKAIERLEKIFGEDLIIE